ASELLTRPRALFLDEPTSGLDPATAAELLAHLRHLADRSATVLFTTHSVADLDGCDRVVFLARGGLVACAGSAAAAPQASRVAPVPELSRRLAAGETAPVAPGHDAGPRPDPRALAADRAPAGSRAGGLTQWAVLTARTAETFVRNPL